MRHARFLILEIVRELGQRLELKYRFHSGSRLHQTLSVVKYQNELFSRVSDKFSENLNGWWM
jgi:hypothetical protein